MPKLTHHSSGAHKTPTKTWLCLLGLLALLVTACACGDAEYSGFEDDSDNTEDSNIPLIDESTNALAYQDDERMVIEWRLYEGFSCQEPLLDPCYVNQLIIPTAPLEVGQILDFEVGDFSFLADLECNNSIPFLTARGQVEILKIDAQKIEVRVEVEGRYEDGGVDDERYDLNINAARCPGSIPTRRG